MLFFYSGISKEGKGWEIFHSIQGFMNPKYLYLSLVMKSKEWFWRTGPLPKVKDDREY